MAAPVHTSRCGPFIPLRAVVYHQSLRRYRKKTTGRTTNIYTIILKRSFNYCIAHTKIAAIQNQWVLLRPTNIRKQLHERKRMYCIYILYISYFNNLDICITLKFQEATIMLPPEILSFLRSSNRTTSLDTLVVHAVNDEY